MWPVLAVGQNDTKASVKLLRSYCLPGYGLQTFNLLVSNDGLRTHPYSPTIRPLGLFSVPNPDQRPRIAMDWKEQVDVRVML